LQAAKREIQAAQEHTRALAKLIEECDSLLTERESNKSAKVKIPQGITLNSFLMEVQALPSQVRSDSKPAHSE
jgi:hypothetical protein